MFEVLFHLLEEVSHHPSLITVMSHITFRHWSLIFPPGSPTVLKEFPAVKTLLLAGPSGVGKKMLVHAVCNETGAHLFHLSPAHLSTRYPSRGGAAYLLHLIFKASLVDKSVLSLNVSESVHWFVSCCSDCVCIIIVSICSLIGVVSPVRWQVSCSHLSSGLKTQKNGSTGKLWKAVERSGK